MEFQSPVDIAESIPKQVVEEYYRNLLDWFNVKKRNFPWRETDNPYFILISEILLQKTNSRAVPDIYLQFIKNYPTPQAVAESSAEAIFELISPLGLFYRAERIISISQTIVENFNGEVPSNLKTLMNLKGVGRYVASAVLCFGFNKPVAILDQNVIRILERVFGIISNKPRPHTDKLLWEAAEILVPSERYQEYNLALLDLSAPNCRPRPQCEDCPLQSICTYFSHLQNSVA